MSCADNRSFSSASGNEAMRSTRIGCSSGARSWRCAAVAYSGLSSSSSSPSARHRRLPVPLGIEHVEADPAFVRRSERSDEHAAQALARNVARRLLTEDRGGHEVVRQRPHRRAEQRHVDDRRLARAFALEQRGRDTACEVRAARGVAERAAWLHELAARGREHVREAATRPVRNRVEAALIAIGTFEALPRTDRVHALGVDRPDVVGVEPQLGARRRQEVRDVHVGPLDQLVERGAALVVA